MKKAVIVIPTYNEAGTIGPLIDQFRIDILPKLHHKYWQAIILVVDGNSPDGTSVIVRQKIHGHDLHLIVEEKRQGIGAAYMKGFAYAQDTLFADVLIEFDADFQHPPETVPDLLAKIDQGYDYVLGSRKMAGGSEFANRDFIRSFLTSAGSWCARLILFFPSKNFFKVTDPTSGLRAHRTNEKAGYVAGQDHRYDVAHLYTTGFGYKIQLLSEALASGARYAEVPLRFQERRSGESKFTPQVILSILWVCILSRLARWRWYNNHE